MNLFSPPKYAKGSLLGVDGNAFSVIAYFNDQATSCNWSKDDIKKVIEQAKSGDYNNLVAIITSHLTTEPTKVFPSNESYQKAEYLEKLEKIRTNYADNPESETYILIGALIEAIENKSEFSDEDDDANSVMNYLCYYTNAEIRKLILLFGSNKELSLKERDSFYSSFTPLITNYLAEYAAEIKFITGDNFSMSDWGGNFYKAVDEDE